MKIIERIIPKGQTKQRPGYSMNPKYITVHETANTSKGANAEMHARYLLNGAGGRTVSWHYTVDDESIYQHLPDNEAGWHAGDGGNGTGNRQSIGVEICVNSDGDFQKAVSNAQKLVKDLMEYHNISIENVVPHKHWTGKNCPANLLNNWSSFKNGIDTKSHRPKRKVSSKPAQADNLVVDGKWGNSTTKALQKALGTPQDGIISHQYRNSVTSSLYGNTVHFSSTGRGSLVIRELQKKVKSSPDGLLGPNTVRQLQKYLGTVQDGKLSRPSLAVKELQRRLNRGDF